MARAKKRAPKEREEEKDDDDEADEGAMDRDFVMARLGGAVASLDAAKAALLGTLAVFVNPEDDSDGGEREEMLDEALEAIGAASRGVESAKAVFDEMEDEDLEIGEPWEEVKAE